MKGGPHDPVGVSGLLSRWERSLGGEDLSLGAKLWNTLRGAMSTIIIGLILMATVLMAVVMAARSEGSKGLVSSIVDLVYAVSLFGCTMAQLFFFRESRRAQDVLQRLVKVARELEDHESSSRELVGLAIDTELDKSGRSARRWFRVMRVYAFMAAVSVTLPHVATLRPVPAVWPPVSGALEVAAAITFAVVSVRGCIGYSEFLNLQLVATISSTGMYRALAVKLLHSDGQTEDLKTIVRLHGELNSAAMALNNLFAPYLPYYLLTPLGGTALATCGYLYGAFSANYSSLVPQIFMMFIPFCLYGDALSVASGPGMIGNAYRSDWLTWTAGARRVLLVVMARGARPQRVTVKGFGSANRSACLKVLKTWFSYLQTLTNLGAADSAPA